MKITGWYNVAGGFDQKRKQKEESKLIVTGAGKASGKEAEVYFKVENSKEKWLSVSMSVQEAEELVRRLNDSLSDAKRMK